MKIEGQRPNAETSAAQRLEGRESSRGQKAGQGQPDTDRVRVSPEASLAGEALRVADQSPAVRPEVVERARQQLLSGEVGRDAGKLADRLIDHLLEK